MTNGKQITNAQTFFSIGEHHAAYINFQKQLTEKLGVQTGLRFENTKGQINFKSTEASFINRRDSRVANTSFTYRFGKPLNGNGQRKKGSAGDEQNRVKAGVSTIRLFPLDIFNFLTIGIKLLPPDDVYIIRLVI